MAKYPATKVLSRAVPTVRSTDGVVKRWDIDVVYSYTDENGITLNNTYIHNEDVEFQNKVVSDFSKSDLVGYMQDKYDAVFDAQFDAMIAPPTEEMVFEFNIDQLDN